MIIPQIKVVSLVYYEHEANEYVLPHNHKYHEMVLYRFGSGYVNIKNERHFFKDNSAFIIKPNDTHDEFTEKFCQVYIVLFKIENEVNIDNLFTNLSQETSEFITMLFKRAINEYHQQNKLYQQQVNYLFSIILLEVLREDIITSDKNANIYIKHVKRYMQENFVQNIDFDLIAKSSGYSYHRFRHIFKEVEGISLKQYLFNIRLEEAKRILSNTDIPINEIGKMCGFNNFSHFTKFFSQRMNISPSKYREMIREKDDLGVVKIIKNKDEDNEEEED